PTARALDRLPNARRQRSDRHGHVVQGRAADQCGDLARLDLQVYDRAVADVGPAARQAVTDVAVRFEVLAPGRAPERVGDGAAFDRDGRDRDALLLSLGQLAGGLGAPLDDADVRPKHVP